jgi:hypothetical protein
MPTNAKTARMFLLVRWVLVRNLKFEKNKKIIAIAVELGLINDHPPRNFPRPRPEEGPEPCPELLSVAAARLGFGTSAPRPTAASGQWPRSVK